MRRASSTLVAVLVGLACMCWLKTGIQGIQPSLSISATTLQFPLTPYGSSLQQSLTLTALSSADVTVTLALTNSGAAAYQLDTPTSLDIPGLGSQTVQITFAPQLPATILATVQTLNATLSVGSNDPNHLSTPVSITGSAQAPQLDVCWDLTPPTCLSKGPLTIDLGSLAPRPVDAGLAAVDIENLAQVPLVVSQFALDSAAQDAGYSIVETVALPIQLSPQSGLSDLFHIKLTPLRSGVASGNLVITSDDPRAGGKPVQVALTATVQPFQPPVACLGIAEIDYVDGQAVSLDPSLSLSSQPSIVPPGPLDSVLITALVSPTCSFDPQDGQSLGYQFGLAPPVGSAAQLAPVNGHPEEQRLQFDLAGTYGTNVKVTDSANLTATASLNIPVASQQDIEATLTWGGIHQADLDLHLVRQLGDAGTSGLIDDPQNDCFWCNCLLPVNYPSGSSPCNVPQGVQYPIALHWGSAPSSTTGNPLLVATQRFEPFPTENLDDARLKGPQDGATYGLYAHYYQAYQTAPDAGTCTSDQDCTDPTYASCWGGECVPITTAELHVYVTGTDISDTLFDGGLNLSAELRRPCDLWYAGELHWISGGHIADGGFSPAVYTFTPGDGGVGNNSPGSSGLTCLAQ